MEMRTVARRIVRFSRDRKAYLYYAACVVLLVVAAGLRFHDLSADSLSLDEAVAANYSKGELRDVISNTRYGNSSPILYPLVLYAVQKIESTLFGIRAVPAMASVLTIVVILFLLPRLGVRRGAAFLSALLATFSVEAIWNAQNAREYSVDALMSVLMIAGLLSYLRDRKKTLLCATLFVAPLVQYGLVLFGVAVIAAAILFSSDSHQEMPSSQARARDWLKQRRSVAWPSFFFLSGAVVSYAVTLRYQWREGGFGASYLREHYYFGEYDSISSILIFSLSKIPELFHYHANLVVGTLSLVALAMTLPALFRREHSATFRYITTLLALSVIIAAAAAVLRVYPLGDIRQCIYLGPIIFLGSGFALHLVADRLLSVARRAWLARAGSIAAPTIIIVMGIGALKMHDPYVYFEGNNAALAVLEDQERHDDIVYVSDWEEPFVKFFHFGKNNYHYGRCKHNDTMRSCLEDVFSLATPNTNRMWIFLSRSPSLEPVWELLPIAHPELQIEKMVENTRVVLWLVSNAHILVDLNPEAWAHATEPIIRSRFDVYHNAEENLLIYVKEFCNSRDIKGKFFLHIVPDTLEDLPDHRKQNGFDNLDFYFVRHGFQSAKLCVAVRALPDYDLTAIGTGQFLIYEDRSSTSLWRGQVRFDE